MPPWFPRALIDSRGTEAINVTSDALVIAAKTRLAQDFQCYALPYGAIGFVSHLLVYWSLYWLLKGKSPWRMKQKLTRWEIDTWFAWTALFGGVGLACYSMGTCRHHWPIVLLAFWKMWLSFCLGCQALRCSSAARRSNYTPDDWILYIALYPVGCVIGFVALGWLLRTLRSDHRIWIITGVAGPTLLLVGFQLSRWFSKSDILPRIWNSYFLDYICAILISIMIVGDLCTDWIIACAANNFGGIPSRDNLLPYMYYIFANSLPLLSF